MVWKKYPAFVALVGLLATLPATANERLCAELGSACVCSEPLNTNTVNGGQTWPGTVGNSITRFIDPDDSPNATECAGEAAGAAIANNTPGTIGVVPANTQPLPPGHSLTWVLRRQGGSIAHLRGPDVAEASDVTYCHRGYHRWDPTSPIPDNAFAPAGSNSQYKIGTVGGWDPEGAANPNQLGVSSGGTIGTRADGNWFNFPPDFKQLGRQAECVNNFCRFEICIDLLPSGQAYARFRQVVLPPSPNAGVVHAYEKPPAQRLRSSISYAQANDVMDWYAQIYNGTPLRYATHAIMAKRRPVNRTWWPGPACEVEGSCNGTPPPPPARPEAPVLLP